MKWALVVALALIPMFERAPFRRTPAPVPRAGISHKTRITAPTFERSVDPARGETSFLAHRGATTLRLTANEATWEFPNGAPPIRMQFLGAARNTHPTASGPVRGVSHYYVGTEPMAWGTVEHYGAVRYEALYPGIDADYDSSGEVLEYGFAVAPHADPSRIRLRFEGADRMEIDALGALVVHSAGGSLREPRPTAYQESGSIRQSVEAAYTLSDDRTVGIRIGARDPTRRLIIDPLVYSTYLGGRGYDRAGATAIDASGNVYVVGSTNSSEFPTLNAAQGAVGGAARKDTVFVTKVDTTGQLVYSTYLGGSGNDEGYGIAIDAIGNAYITGETGSSNFPTTRGAAQVAFAGDPCGTYGCTDAFIAKLSPTGTLVYSTYLGGAGWDVAFAIALGPTGDAYVTGFTRSSDFPVSADALQPHMAKGGVCAAGRFPGDPNDPSGLCFDAFVTRVNANGTGLVYSTYLGGQGDDSGTAIAVDQAGNAYVTGGTDDAAQTFPTTPGAFQTKGGLTFVSKLNPTGSTLVYSTLLGASTGYYEDTTGEIQGATGIAVDGAGNVFLSGYTSTADLPTTPNVPFPKRPGGGYDAFVMKVNASGTELVYSTFLGGKNSEIASAIAIDAAGRAYVTGWTRSSDFPVTASNVQSTLNPGTCGSSPAPSTCPDAFITRLAPDGSAIEYSTYLGGSGLDEGNGIAVNIRGTVAVAGLTNSTDFPTANARQSVSGDEAGMPHGDAFITTLSLDGNQSAPEPLRRR